VLTEVEKRLGGGCALRKRFQDLPADPGLIIKDSYWHWPERNLAGNAIDFHVQILGLSFHDTVSDHRYITSPLAS